MCLSACYIFRTINSKEFLVFITVSNFGFGTCPFVSPFQRLDHFSKIRKCIRPLCLPHSPWSRELKQSGIQLNTAKRFKTVVGQERTDRNTSTYISPDLQNVDLRAMDPHHDADKVPSFACAIHESRSCGLDPIVSNVKM